MKTTDIINNRIKDLDRTYDDLMDEIRYLKEEVRLVLDEIAKEYYKKRMTDKEGK